MRARVFATTAAVLALGVSAFACGDNTTGAALPPLPWALTAFPSVVDPPDNPSTPAKVELGRMLFHDPLLSSDRQVACVTCHGQIWGLSDGLPQSIGVGGVGPAGTGRTGPTHTRRNSSTIWNAGVRASQFWDGRATTLEAQALFPLAAAVEMGRPAADVVADLAAIPAYVSLFTAAFPGDPAPVTKLHMQQAIAAFERTFVSDLAPYDRYAAGDVGALDDESVRGMFLFARAGCTSCHAPPTFDVERFEPTLVAATPGVVDDGRAEVTNVAADRGRFRVPTLRNARVTSPYFHDGSGATLLDAVTLEATRSGTPPLAPADLAAITRFLDKGLEDESHVPSRPKVVPSGLMVPLDGYQIPR